MNIVNSNRLRVSIRFVRRGYGERFCDMSFGTYRSADHGKPRPERNFYAHAVGIVADMKWRPDGKRDTPSAGAEHAKE